MQDLKVLYPRDCPNCTSPAGQQGCDYTCPKCRQGFCSHCYRTDHKGDGTYVFCPHCGEKLQIPSNPKCHPEFNVGDICTFTNKGSSGVRSNDGKECSIARLKEREMWINSNVPEYVIRFGDGNGFGASERELQFKLKQ